MKSHGLAALAPLTIILPSPPSGETGRTAGFGRTKKAITTANLEIEHPEFDRKILPECAEKCTEFSLLTCQQHTNLKTKYTLIKKWRKESVSSFAGEDGHFEELILRRLR